MVAISAGEGVVEGRLLERPNRYLARVDIDGREQFAHVPNPGRMTELMIAGRTVHLRPATNPDRKTAWDLLGVLHETEAGVVPVCIDNRLGGKLARAALEQRSIPELGAYDAVRPEVRWGASRLDFRLEAEPAVWVEVKSCTLVDDGHGRFPDAPTVRGRRHLGELTALVGEGQRAAALFVVQRDDVRSVGPNDGTDPDFGEALRAAEAAGVMLLAVRCGWSVAGLQLRGAIPVFT
ncbi:MAG: DNA/RNA nuclease SfsA [Armatimonadetes bacterium]|nr:DNA/RNA nuclease SfsA [Armatimonadota bacterium]